MKFLSNPISTRIFHLTYNERYFLLLGKRFVSKVDYVRHNLDAKTYSHYYYLTDALYKELIDSSIETESVV